jgi:hypothetical protein
VLVSRITDAQSKTPAFKSVVVRLEQQQFANPSSALDHKWPKASHLTTPTASSS